MLIRYFFSLNYIVLIITFSPCLLLFKVEKFRDHYVCLPEWPWSKNIIETYLVMRAFHIFGFIVLYALPLLITALVNCLVARRVWFHKSPGNASSNRASKAARRKVIRMLAIVVVGFALCWLLCYINHYFKFFQPAVWKKFPSRSGCSIFGWGTQIVQCNKSSLLHRFKQSFSQSISGFFDCAICISLSSSKSLHVLFYIETMSRHAFPKKRSTLSDLTQQNNHCVR